MRDLLTVIMCALSLRRLSFAACAFAMPVTVHWGIAILAGIMPSGNIPRGELHAHWIIETVLPTTTLDCGCTKNLCRNTVPSYAVWSAKFLTWIRVA